MRIQIKAHPKSKKVQIRKNGESFYEVWVQEAPEDGKANEAILRILAKELGLSRNKLSIISGLNSKNKWVQVL